MSTFYKMDSTRVSHKEYWWGSRSPLVLLGWMLKWLRVRLPSSADDANVDSLSAFEVESLPPEVQRRFDPLLCELATLGFGRPLCHLIHDPGTCTTLYWMTLLHGNGLHFARIHNRIWTQSKPPDRGLFSLFYTRFSEGSFLVSSSGKPDTDTPESVRMNRMQGVGVLQLWESHQRRVAELAGKEIRLVQTPEELREASEAVHGLLRDYHLARGFFRCPTVGEEKDAVAFAAKVAEGSAAGLENPEVMAELERLQTSKPSWGNALWILAISLVAFLAAGTGSDTGSGSRKWEYSLMLILVLLFHESGHWVAMRLCRYRNLRMFFIPFFGAAVTGRNWNVPGWKKVLVSLAGPVPGILLGAILAGLSMVTHQGWLERTALVMLVLNAFNLLPVLPLDGGHVMHSTLFCRNRWLDVAFRLVAVACLLALGFVGGKVFLLIAICLALGLPVAFKRAKVTDRLRPEQLPELESGQDLIPVATAQRILAALKSEFPTVTNPKLLAQHVLGVFESLNAKPPGALATVALLGVHAGTFLLAAVFAFLLQMNRSGWLADFATAGVKPEHTYVCGTLQRQPLDATPLADTHHTLVASFPLRAEAEQAFSGLRGRIPTGSALALFGDTVLLSVSAEDEALREKWFNEFQLLSTNVFAVLTNRGAPMHFTATAPNGAAASNLVEEVQAYMPLSESLLAPWAPAGGTPEFAGSLAARRLWSRWDRETITPMDDPRMKEIQKQILAATRRGAMSEVERYRRQHADLIQELQRQAHQRISDQAGSQADRDLADLHLQLASLPYTNRTARATVVEAASRRLGAVPRAGGIPDPGSKALGAMSGMAFARGHLVQVNWLTFPDPALGAPAFADWLCSLGFTEIRYSFHGGLGVAVDEEGE